MPKRTYLAGLRKLEPRKIDFLFLVAGASVLSFSPVFVNVAAVGPAIAGFYRVLIGGLVLLVVAGVKREVLWTGWPSFRLALLAGVFFALDLTLWHRSIDYVGPGLATILGNFQVFFLALFGVLFIGERINWTFVLALPLAMLGIVMIVWGEWTSLGADYRTGVFWGLATALLYASFVLTLRKSQSLERPLSPIANITVVSGATMVVLGLEAVWQGQSFAIADLTTGSALLGYGIVGQVLGWVWVTRGLKSTPASLAGLILLLQPTLAFNWDILFFDRPTDGLDFLGAALALSAIYLGTRGSKRTAEQRP